MRLQMGVSETLLPNVVTTEAHQNDCSYVHVHKDLISMVSGLAWKTSKNHKTVKSKGQLLMQGWALAQDNMVLVDHFQI